MKTDTETLIARLRQHWPLSPITQTLHIEAADRLEELQRDLAQAISERTPHDYGLLAEQRDDYRRRWVVALEEIEEARAEVERLKDHVPDATKMIRPEPSRLEIAAMLCAACMAPKAALAQADELIAEAKEGHRKNLVDDHLPHRGMIEVELADAVIRIADLCGALNLDLGGAVVEKLVYNMNRADHKIENRKSENGKKT